MSRRLRPVEVRGVLLFAVAAAIGAPTFNGLAAMPVLPGLALFWIVQGRLDRFRRPELALLGSLACVQLGLAASVALASGPRMYLLPLFIMPVLLASVAFPVRIAAVAVVASAQLMVAVALGFDRAEVWLAPFALLYPLAVMISGAGIAMVVADLDVSTRGTAIVDPLTGMPNRIALRARVAELEHQSSVTHRPVAVIVGDPDRFKRVNDTCGHAVGDAVLREVAARIRAELPAGASAYRLGGEEFVVLVSDADVGVGAEVADRLRNAVGERAIEGLSVVMSFGVAASGPGEAFSFGYLFGRADRALYEAKHVGGNRVRVWPLSGRENGSSPALRATQGTHDLAQLEHEFERRRSGAQRGAESGGPALGDAEDAERALADRWARWNEVEHAATGNWLVHDDVQRRQLLELNRRLRERAKPAFVIGFALGGLSAIQYGWLILIPPAAMAVLYILAEHHIERFKHPEYALGIGWVCLQSALLLSGLLASGPMVFASPLLLMLVVGSSAVFPPRGVVIGIALTIAIIVLVGVAEDVSLVLSAPGIMAFDVMLVISAAMMGSTIGRSTIDYRDLAIVDQLTGLFNRAALIRRVAELSHRAGVGSAPVALLVADVDQFKSINDSYGHATGDVVLKEIGYRVRKNLRAFESAYRIGGEEFVVLLDDVDWERAENVAARLREAIREAPIAGVRTTVSFGLAATSPGEAFHYDAVFRRADAALYAAKRAGGDQVYAGRQAAADGDGDGAVQAELLVGGAPRAPQPAAVGISSV